MVVLDASAAVAWMYGEEPAEKGMELYSEVKLSGAVVPQIWKVEIANVLLTGLRKGRHDLPLVQEYIATFSKLRIVTDTYTGSHAWGSTLLLAARHKLTSYDAAYLELAARLRVPLATFDKALVRAAEIEGVALFWN